MGNSAFPALSMFKVLLLQRWRNPSDREMEAQLIDRISLVRFTCFSLNYEEPESCTIFRFRNHLANGGLEAKLLNMINSQLEAHGLMVKQEAIVEASVVEFSRSPPEDI